MTPIFLWNLQIKLKYFAEAAISTQETQKPRSRTSRKTQQHNKLEAAYIFIIEHVVLSNDVLNFIDSVVGLGFRKGALLAKQADVERSCPPKLLMENLQVIAKKKMLSFTFRGNTTTCFFNWLPQRRS